MPADARNALPFAITLMLASCEEPAITTADSLVGAESLPSGSVLAGEIIEISRTFEADTLGVPFHLLSYELGPDDTLTVTHILRDYPDDKTIDRETFQLTAEGARQARQKLWRVRPAALEAFSDLGDYTRPVGCTPQSDHDQGEVSIVFLDSGDSSELDDDRLAVFELPYRGSCNNERAASARKLIDDVLRSYPRSRVAGGFPS